nr:NADH-ubiquinone oxidoreductase chain N (EC 1.6.5.3) [Kibdelosporangium sp. MJ126-NF4]
MTMMDEDPSALLPEIFLALAAVLGLLLGSYLPRRRQWPVIALAVTACAAGIVATALAGPDRTVFGESYRVDTLTNLGRYIVIGSLVFAIGVSVTHFRGHKREAELYVLMLLATLGTVIMTGANDLMLLVAGYLLASIPLYALAGFGKDDLGTEAAMKYYLMGALCGILMLAGVTVLFGVGGATGYPEIALSGASGVVVAIGLVGVFAGLLFKIGAVPVHFWVPDVTEGTRPPVAAFVTTVPKIGALIAMFRLVQVDIRVDWPVLVAVIAAVTMTLGNFGAFFQDNVRRLLAYSTISQVGYLLMAVAVATRSDWAQPGLLIYLAAYAVTNLGAFAVVCALPKITTVSGYSGLFRTRPWLAITLVVCLLGLVGTPPTPVFVGKLAVFTATVDGGFAWLAIIAAVNTVASLFYYLRWIAPTLSRET